MGILRVTGLGLVALGLWAGMQSRTLEDDAPAPADTVAPAPASEQRRPVAYPFERKPVMAVAPSTGASDPPTGTLAQSPPPRDIGSAMTASVTGDAVMIRARPTKRSHALGKLRAGTSVSILEKRGNWVRIRPDPPDREGWMSIRFISARPPPEPDSRPNGVALR